MKKEVSRVVKTDEKKQIKFTNDGWVNALTSMGVFGKDKKLSTYADYLYLDQVTQEALWQSDFIAKKIIERPAREMVREGYKFSCPDINTELLEDFHLEMERKNVDEKLEEALMCSRAFGGAAIFVGADSKDDIDPLRKEENPLDLNKLTKINYLIVLDRYELIAGSIIDTNLSSPNFGFPLYYTLSSNDMTPGKSNIKIHHSRLIRFFGTRLNRRMRRTLNYWGDSVLSCLFNAIRNYQIAYDTVPSIIQDFVNVVLKMQNLPDIISEGADGDVMLQQRLTLLNMTTSVLKAMIIQTDEDVEKKTTSVAGIGDLLKGAKDYLQAATDMPHTILFNESAGGLGSTGDSEKRDWYDHIKDMQESQLRNPILRLVELFRAVPDSVLYKKKGDITLEFNPLWQMDEKQLVEIRKIQSETDSAYIDRQVYDPIEVRNSRFGGGQYCLETEIDTSLTEKMEQQRDEEPVNNPPSSGASNASQE